MIVFIKLVVLLNITIQFLPVAGEVAIAVVHEVRHYHLLEWFEGWPVIENETQNEFLAYMISSIKSLKHFNI